jgi:hypothetical protein
MTDSLVHIGVAGTKRGPWWWTFCGHRRKGDNVARRMWITLYGFQYVTCEECIVRVQAFDRAVRTGDLEAITRFEEAARLARAT